MKILIYWEQESWGGVDTHLLELLGSWPNHNDEIVLLVNDGNAGFNRLKRAFSELRYVKCISFFSSSHNELNRRLRASKWLGWLTKVLYFALPLTHTVMVHRLHREFRRLGTFDVLLANNGGYPAAWGTISALAAGLRARIPARLMLIHHAAKPPAALMGLFERWIDSRLRYWASALICVSHATRSELLKNRWVDEAQIRIRVIHNAISLNEPISKIGAPNIKKLLTSYAGERLVGIVGRVEPYKGHEDLIYALARLEPQMRQQIQVVVLGSASNVELSRLRRIAEALGVANHLQFLGYLEGRPIDLIAQLDLLVVATRSFEGFGLTLIEAMSVGVPILATRVGAIPEFIFADSGVLINPAAPLELAEQLSNFITANSSWSARAIVAKKNLGDRQASMTEEYRYLFTECLAENFYSNQ
jgi:glycosyltransferase involved in cell wall biosynthesis